MEIDEAIHLSRSIELLQEQRDNPDPQFVQQAKRAMRGTFDFVRDVVKHVNRRTMPKTYVHGGAGQATTSVIGYRHKSK